MSKKKIGLVAFQEISKITLGVKAGFVLAVWKNLLLCFTETNMKCHSGEKLFLKLDMQMVFVLKVPRSP